MSRCRDKVDVIVTDSPLPLSIFYNKSEVLGEDFNKTIMNCFNSFDNISYLLLRDKPYNPKGRLQTEAESDALKEPLINLLQSRNIKYETVKGNVGEYDKIANYVIQKILGV